MRKYCIFLSISWVYLSTSESTGRAMCQLTSVPTYNPAILEFDRIVAGDLNHALMAEHIFLISPSVPVFTPMLLIFTIDLANTALKSIRVGPLPFRKLCTKVLVEASVHSFWSDSKTPLPLLKFAKKDVSKRLGLPVSRAMRLVASPFCGHRDWSWETKEGSMEGSAPLEVVVVKL